MKLRKSMSVVAVAAAFGAVGVAPANAATAGKVTVRRDGPVRVVPFTVRDGGEALVSLTAAAPGVSWGRKGAESAVVAVDVDGKHVTDLVVPSAVPTARSFALGSLKRGHHVLGLRFSAKASAPAARSVVLSRPAVATPRADQTALRYAPVVVGRTLAALGDPYQNARTDTPLIGWHEELPAATPGHRVFEYSVVWSNEDGGTDTPALMARWGRSTDIEWVYRVEVDAHGERVPGSDVYQAANHQTLHFTGTYEGDHPLIQTCTSNNNMCDQVTKPAPLRFFLDTTQTRPADRAREVLMDRNAWTYPVMAQEMLRENKIENPSDPATPLVGDQRTYLYIEIKKQTGAATGTGSVPGVSVGVRLKGDPKTLYRSDHAVPSWSIERDVPAATTVELPAGTKLTDVASVEAIRQPIGAGDNGAPATVTAINRAFFLGADYLPQASTLTWKGEVTLTADRPTAVLTG
ncbi:hypothetical protein [Actinomadura rayongensis]|uniref:Uncharacterized protein n=1 Tax=Actinomadura rayongensis TaxID=1429076 RepID=A0A6I4WCT2_9ACTN|nr:hypothetical protein [Actinomadura rayongensis]MXQ68027.1 hypothetical protein [Actinomadura rayongensis]